MAGGSDPGFVFFALGRCGYGAAPGDVSRVATMGFPAWVNEQLVPRNVDDGPCLERLTKASLHIKYNGNDKYPAIDEQRPLQELDKPIEAVWSVFDPAIPRDGVERRRFRDEVMASTLIRACTSRWQLREVLVSFWHDHFNVDATNSEQVAVALPSYDRDVIRAHALGNFREFLEAVATSTAMQYYLNNRSSRAGSANENFARELFELHTLGSGAYFNDRYDRWRDVPGALQGRPEGYIDQDVYEAARALTGWTIEDGGSIDGKRALPRTGKFTYVESWHDGYQKRVLASEFQPFAAAMVDGRAVLDLVATHPATARHVCTKLCRRLVGEDPPNRLVQSIVQVWMKYQKAPDQLARVVKAILLSPDFALQRASKMRRPLDLAVAFARAVALDLNPTEGLFNKMAEAGQRLFGWPTPDGLPDTNQQFTGTNLLRKRWELVLGLTENSFGTGVFEPAIQFAGRPMTPAAALQRWLPATLGADDADTATAILAGFGQPATDPIAAPDKPLDANKRLARLAAYCGMTPAFQLH